MADKKKIILYSLGALAGLVAISYMNKDKLIEWLKPLANFKITSPFGTRVHPVTKKVSTHNGIDISAPVGTPIKAPADAKVLRVYENNIGGLQIILLHDKGIKTGYAHLSAASVKQGDTVTKGQIIGKVGKSGRVTGAHLHFTVKDGEGKFINPETFIFTA